MPKLIQKLNETLFVKISIFLVFLLYFSFIESQNQQIDLTISNDKFVFIDRYYTSGLHLSYRKGLKQNFIFTKQEDNKLQLNITVGNETYTPTNLNSFDNRNFDRPYAGWLFGKLELGRIKEKSALFFAVESGVTGEESLAGKLQISLHEFFNIDSMPTWADEIAYKWLFNFKASKIYDFQLNNKNSIQNQIRASIGSKDTYIMNDFVYFFGKFNDLQNSSRLNLVDNSQNKEFYGFVSAGYKYVLLNTLIQGSAFSNDDPFTSIATKSIFKLSAGAVLKTKKNIIKLGYYFNTKETPMSTSHAYGALTFGFSF